MSQNIYDNQYFFNEYQKLRSDEYSANIIEESPNFMDMLPPVFGSVLDLGCGAGENCREFMRKGAGRVVGIDISQNMINLANEGEVWPGLEFHKMNMSDISSLTEKFDLVTSSLAVHYISDFEELVHDVFYLLNDGGYFVFVFSQEHPIFTAPRSGMLWQSDINGHVHGAVVTDYPISGERKTFWLVDGVVKYHRTFSDIINPILRTGFILEEIREPVIDEKFYSQNINYTRTKHIPDYLMIRAKKIDFVV